MLQPNKQTKMELLAQASSVLEDQLLRDTSPELNDLFRGRGVSFDPETTPRWNYLKADGAKDLPDAIIKQYESLECRSFMGIFEHINRVWITIDNRLYLWNYASAEGEINVFDDQDQIIVSVGIAKPIPGIFLEQIEYILVISTPLEIILLGIAFVSAGSVGKAGPMTIYRTDMTVSSDNINMTQIEGTSAGRIFMRGSNGQLYELVYQAQDGWLTRKIRKVNLSTSSLSLLVPEFLRWRPEDYVSKFVIDDDRHVLYILTNDNQIQMNYLGREGQSDFTAISTLSDILARALRLADNLPQTPLDERNFQIISLHPVLAAESRIINLVAITATGHRLYFSHTADSNRFTQWSQPSSLRLLYVRPSPSLTGAIHYNSAHGVKIHEAYYANGITIAAQSMNDEIDRIIGVSPESGIVAQASQKFLIENSSYIDIHGKSWAVCEAPQALYADLHKNNETCGFFLNELVTQLEYPARQFYLLTNNGLTTVTKLRPIDILLQLINSSPTSDVRSFKDFATSFGHEQVCAMSIAIACEHPLVMYGVSGKTHIRNMASKLYFDLGGHPTVNQGTPGYQSQRFQGSPSTGVFETNFSPKHSGLSLYLCRILRPIWKKELVTNIISSSVSEKTFVKPSISQDVLIRVQLNLQSLDRFLKSYPMFTARPTPDTTPVNVDAVAWKTEQQSFANLHELIVQAIETISFLSMLIDHSLPKIVSQLPGQDAEDLNGLTFELFVFSIRGREIAKSLMSALVNIQIERDIGVDSIIETLKQRCPTICEEHDTILFKGVELIQKSRITSNRLAQEKLLNQALKMFLSVLQTMSAIKLADIVESFKALGFYLGIIDLVLAYASQLNSGIVTGPTKDVANQVYYRRIDCYQLIFNTIASIDSLIASNGDEDLAVNRNAMLYRALLCTDQLFHFCLYEWFIQQNWTEALLEIQSPFLEQYLLEDENDIQRNDLLWRFYVRNGKFMQSAQVLNKIANSPGLSLSDRLEYLTKAVINAKSAPGIELGKTQQILTDLVDELDCARIQMEILNILTLLPHADHEIEQLHSQLFELDYLYHTFALEYQLNDIILLILHAADHGVPGKSRAEAAWSEIIRKSIICFLNLAIAEAHSNTRSPYDSVSERIKMIGRKVYPDENVFPLRYLVSKLEQISLLRMEGDIVAPNGWVVSALHHVKVPYMEIFRVYHEIFEAKLPPWSTNKALAAITSSIISCIGDWIEHVHSPSGASEKSDFPAILVDESLGKYIVAMYHDSELVGRLQQLQSTLRSAF